MAKADELDSAEKKMKALTSDFEQSQQTVPVASQDVEAHNPNDIGANTKASYKPADWVKGLNAASQPMWVQEKMGVREKEEALFYQEVFTKYARSSNEVAFQLSLNPDEKKAMEEGTDNEGGYFVPEAFINSTIHDHRITIWCCEGCLHNYPGGK